MNVLVCGGAGYIGSHMCKWLAENGANPIVFDDLSSGNKEAVRFGRLIVGNLADADLLDRVFSSMKIDVVMHFCARSMVGESVVEPFAYYQNNVAATLVLLEAMRRHGVMRIIFSSTASVFGEPMAAKIDEEHPKNPINPYGASKLMVERILQDAAVAYGLRSVTLRYFNAAGASSDGDIGEAHDPETHLIPNAIRAALGTAEPLKVFGDDWPTRDGTCVRDYVHVDDLAFAHGLAMRYMDDNPGAHAFNLGSGTGFTVREVIKAVERATGRVVPFSFASRRAGDPPILVAASERAESVLGWKPRHLSIDSMVQSATRWHLNEGY